MTTTIEASDRGQRIGNLGEGRYLKAYLSHLAGLRAQSPSLAAYGLLGSRARVIEQYAETLAEALADVPTTLRRLADEIEQGPA